MWRKKSLHTVFIFKISKKTFQNLKNMKILKLKENVLIKTETKRNASKRDKD